MVSMPLFNLDAKCAMPVVVGPMVEDWFNLIASYLDPPAAARQRDVDESLLVFSKPVVFAFNVVTICIFMLLCLSDKLNSPKSRKSRKSRNFWNIVELLLDQANGMASSRHAAVKVRCYLVTSFNCWSH